MHTFHKKLYIFINFDLIWYFLLIDIRPEITTLYFDEPDHTGHDPGPDTPEVSIKAHLLSAMETTPKRFGLC